MSKRTISVIVPVYNDTDGIETTLTSLLGLDFPNDRHEIVIVDNGSTDATRSTAERLSAGYEHVRVIVEDDIQSSYAARNRGIEYSTGELVAFIDADMAVAETWLSRVNAFFEETGADYAGCNVEVYLPEGSKTFAGRYNVATGFPVEYYLTEQDFVPTCCLAVRRAVFDDIGQFRPRVVSGEDSEFGRRVAAAGYNQLFADDITMYHPARTTLGGLLSKSVRQGRGREQRYQQANTSIQFRPWYHPRNILPPHPGRFHARLSESSPSYQSIVFYVIAYLCKLAKEGGQIQERFL